MAEALLLFFQNLRNPVLDLLFDSVRLLAEPMTAAVFIIAVYWCYDKNWGKTLGYTVLSGSLLCNAVKNFFRIPRPFVQNDQLLAQNVATATGYSFPSGHTQNASVLSFSAAKTGPFCWRTKKVLFAFSFFFSLLVALSRMYHGVHTIFDVAGGLFLGIVWAFFCPFFLKWIEEKNNDWYYSLFLVPIVLNFVAFLPFWSSRPAQFHDSISLIGLLSGMMLGFFLEKRSIQFTARKKGRQRMARIIFGLAGALLILWLFQLLSFWAAPSVSEALRLLKYFLFALWATAGAPAAAKKCAPDRK